MAVEHEASGHRRSGGDPGVRAARTRHAERHGGERERPYLSIREVLELLVAEFPDITISKIRFLESKGLIEPERTPSGYRTFFGPDVERLRWILLQQREHFLPLKVIKGRLDTAAGVPQGGAVEASLFDDELREPPVAGSHLAGVASHPSAEGAGLRLMAEPSAAPEARQALALLERVRDEPAGGGEQGRRDEPPGSGATAGAGDEPVAAAPDPDQLGTGAPPGSFPEAGPPAAPTRPEKTARGSRPARREPTGARSAAQPRRARSGSRGGAGAGTGHGADPPSGVALSAGELAAAAGVDAALVAELEEYRLVRCRMVGGERCYDEEALTVTRLARAFRAYGIEARHLTTFRHAAEREAGLFSQVVMPLLRQRNPTAREQARAGLAELAELGAELQAVLVRAELRGVAGG